MILSVFISDTWGVIDILSQSLKMVKVENKKYDMFFFTKLKCHTFLSTPWVYNIINIENNIMWIKNQCLGSI